MTCEVKRCVLNNLYTHTTNSNYKTIKAKRFIFFIKKKKFNEHLDCVEISEFVTIITENGEIIYLKKMKEGFNS